MASRRAHSLRTFTIWGLTVVIGSSASSDPNRETIHGASDALIATTIETIDGYVLLDASDENLEVPSRWSVTNLPASFAYVGGAGPVVVGVF